MESREKTFCYRFFNNPGNLEEVLDKAKRKGNRAEIRIWTNHTDAGDVHHGRIKTYGFTSFYFTPLYMVGPVEEYHEKNKRRALALKRWLEKRRVEVTFVDKYN